MYKLVLCYDGTAYHGWQRQRNGITVQEKIEDVLEFLSGEKTVVHGCSRTDAGVHAKEFVCSFDTKLSIPCDKLPYAMNAHLPDDISIMSCCEMHDDFHARFSCIGKEYMYLIDNSPHKNPFLKDRACHFPYKLNYDQMCKAAEYMRGRRDYSAFCASGATVKDFVRNLEFVRLDKKDNIIEITTRADGYLYNMVRIIAGTLMYVGCGKLYADDIDDIINSGDRRRAGITAVPEGLYLNRVFY